MPDPDSYPTEIEVLDSIDAIRRRPAMFVGPLDAPETLLKLLAEALCLALDNAMSGCATEIAITLNNDGRITVRDDGPGLSIDADDNGQPPIETLLTELHACRDAKRKPHNSLCGIGLVATNALSKSLTIETVQHGWLWRQEFTNGRSQRPIQKIEQSTNRHQQITYLPDPQFFGENRLSPQHVAEWFTHQNFNLGQTTVHLHQSDNTQQLHPRQP